MIHVKSSFFFSSLFFTLKTLFDEIPTLSYFWVVIDFKFHFIVFSFLYPSPPPPLPNMTRKLSDNIMGGWVGGCFHVLWGTSALKLEGVCPTVLSIQCMHPPYPLSLTDLQFQHSWWTSTFVRVFYNFFKISLVLFSYFLSFITLTATDSITCVCVYACVCLCVFVCT